LNRDDCPYHRRLAQTGAERTRGRGVRHPGSRLAGADPRGARSAIRAYVLVDGIFILAAIATGAQGTQQRREMLLLEGIASITAGVLTFVWPGITALALLYLIAAWALITGVLEVATAIRLRRAIRNEWLLGLSGVLSVLLAIVLVLMPGAGALAITWLIGWYAVLFGVLLLARAWRVRKVQVQLEGGVLRMGQAEA
jgi:uncharacterized membrane protein HdeD (DUF308 family)